MIVRCTFCNDTCGNVVVRTCEVSGRSSALVSMVQKMSSVLHRIPWQPSPGLLTHRLNLLNNWMCSGSVVALPLFLSVDGGGGGGEFTCILSFDRSDT